MKQPGHYSDYRWFIAIIKQNKWFISGVTLLAGVLVYVAAQFITPEYTSSAIVYPAAEQQQDELKLSQGSTLLLLQLLETSRFKDSVVQHFNLAKHYNISGPQKKKNEEVRKILSNNTNFERTHFKSVKIAVRDHDPEFAARLANGMVDLSNAINQEIFRENTHEKMIKFRQEYQSKKQVVDSIQKQIKQSQEQQTSEAIEKINRDLARLKPKINALHQELDFLRKKHGVHNLNRQIDEIKSDYNDAANRLSSHEAARQVYKTQGWEDSLARTKATFQSLASLKKQLKSKLDSLQVDAGRYNELTYLIAQNRAVYDELKARKARIQSELNPHFNSFEIEILKTELKNQINTLNELREKHEKALSVYGQPIPVAYTFSKAQPSYQQSHPRTMLLTGGSMVLAFVLSISILLLSKTLKQDER